MRKPPYKWILAGLLLVLVGIGFPRLHRGYEALLFMADLAGHEVPSLLDTRPPSSHHGPVFVQGAVSFQADLYRTEQPPKAKLLLIHGAVPDGKDNPRLRRFAITLARSGFAVLVPNIPSLKSLQLTPETIREITLAYRHLLTEPTLASTEHAGMTAISVGVGPTLLAALDPEIRDQVDFVLAIGGYHDLPRLLTYHTTGHYQAPNMERRREPNEYAKWVFVLSHLERLENARDRELLRALAHRKLEDLQAPIMDLVTGLSLDGQKIYRFANNREPEQSATLMRQLPASIQADIAALDLSNKDLSGVKGEIILVHGLDDDVIPFHESEALAQALPDERTRLFVIDGLHHVKTLPGALDLWHLWQAIDALLALRFQ